MPRYNLAYCPSNHLFSRHCVQYAREHFETLANGYLLGRNALPHVTLCQFEAAEDKLSDIWKAAKKNLCAEVYV